MMCKWPASMWKDAWHLPLGKRKAHRRHRLTPIRMAVMKKTKTALGEGVEELKFVYCWSGCKMVQPLWETIRPLHTHKLNTEASYDPAIPLLGTYPKELQKNWNRNLHTHVHSCVIYNIAKRLRQPKCSSVDEHVNKMWYTHTVEYYSA